MANAKKSRTDTDGTPTLSTIFDPAPQNFVPIPMDIYSATRLEYFAALALQGILSGRSEKDQRTAPKRAIEFAQEMEVLLDKV